MPKCGWKGIAAGMLGGAGGTFVLNMLQQSSLKASGAIEARYSHNRRYTRQQKELMRQFEQAHVRTADVVAGVVGLHVPPSRRGRAARIAEYGFGVLCAGAYGLTAEHFPEATAGFGTVYGAVLFTGASEVVLPLLGWVASPRDRTPVQHLSGLSGNLVYGLVTEAVRRSVR